MFAGGVVFLAVNVILIANAVSLATGSRVRPLLEDYVRHAGPAFAIMAFIAALAASLWRISAPLELLLAGPGHRARPVPALRLPVGAREARRRDRRR